MEISIHDVTEISAQPVNEMGSFVTRNFVFTSSRGEKLTVNVFGDNAEAVSLKVLTHQTV